MGLAKYIAHRVALYFSILIISISAIYIALRTIPGDPITVLYGEYVPSHDVRISLEHSLGLDKPMYIQILIHIKRVFLGDLGSSIYYGVPVINLIMERLKASLTLALLSTAISMALCLASAYMEFALGRGRRILITISSISPSLPTLGWGSLLLAASIYMGLPIKLGDIAPPLIVLTIIGFGFLYRYLRASLIELYEEDFVEMYRSMGYGLKRIFVNLLRLALPHLTTILLYRAGLITISAITVETLFRYPGLGTLLAQALESRDYPIIIGWTFAATTIVVVLMAIADLIHIALDPRVGRHEL